jgi:hypothetical protein
LELKPRPIADVIEAETSLEAAEKAFPEYEVVPARNGIPADFSVGRVVKTVYGKRYMSIPYKIGAEKHITKTITKT